MIDLEKLVTEERVGNFTDRSDYNSFVEELDVWSDAKADKNRNGTSFILSEIEDVGLNFC